MNNYQTECQIVILAAGRGSRMSSELPKVMQQIGSKPMLEMVIDNAKTVTDNIIIVHSEALFNYVKDYQNTYKLILQATPNGTAGAVHSAIDSISNNKLIVVLYADNPFITPKIIKNLINCLTETKAAIVTLAFNRPDPAQYGRLITDKFGNLLKIAEFKDASEKERQIQLCNSGIMVFKAGILPKYLHHCLVKPENTGSEFYLTDLIAICKNHGEKVSYLLASEQDAVIGVNTHQELAAANRYYEQGSLPR